MKTLLIIGLAVLSTAVGASECKARLEPLLASKADQGADAAFELCEVEANAGDAEALYYLSFFYFGPLGAEPDEARGVEVIRSSAEKGYAVAQYWMGWQSEVGSHLPQSDEAALEWYQKAAQSDYSLAMERLEKAYRNGELGLQVDEEMAQRYSRKP
jgi:TPR repeat protein